MAEDKKKEETKAESTESTEATETVESKPKSDLIKYIIFGVVGLVLIGGIAFGVAFMLKDSPKADVEESTEVADNSQVEKKSDSHASKDLSRESSTKKTHIADDKRDDNLEISKEDFYDAGEEEFDSKAIEKIVDNLAFLEYTPTDSEIESVESGMSVEDSLEQLNWIEKEKLTLDTRKKELDAREKELDRVEKSVDSKIIRIEQAESNRTSQLAKLYDGMDSRAVAKLMMNLDDNTIVTILPRMKSKNAALVLQLLPSKRAAALSKKMITIADK